MTQRIDITVAAIVERNERFLLVEEEANGRLVFNQPAGHLEPGESLIEAVARETLEETGFTFEPETLLGVYLWHSEEADASFLRFAFCGFAAEPATTPTLDDGILATHWLTRAQIVAQENRLRSPLVLRCIDDWLSGTRYSLDVLSELPIPQLKRLAGP